MSEGPDVQSDPQATERRNSPLRSAGDGSPVWGRTLIPNILPSLHPVILHPSQRQDHVLGQTGGVG